MNDFSIFDAVFDLATDLATDFVDLAIADFSDLATADLTDFSDLATDFSDLNDLSDLADLTLCFDLDVILFAELFGFDFADDFDEGFNAMINSCGSTVEAMNRHASSSWWGDGDDYIIYLKNLDTDTYLYDNIEEYEEYSSDDEDWDDWN
jgi:hypothetical protein